jgi:E3 ubiquitin-protein ligase HUWE1
MFTNPREGVPPHDTSTQSSTELSHKLLAKIVCDSGLIGTLTTSLCDLDVSYPGARRVVKYVLRPLKLLTELANYVSQEEGPPPTGTVDLDDDHMFLDAGQSTNEVRDATPNLQYSSIELFDAARDDDIDMEMEEMEDEDQMESYEDGDEYDDQMEFVEEGDNTLSDEDEMIDEEGDEEGDEFGEGSEMDMDEDNELSMSDAEETSSGESDDDEDQDDDDDDPDDEEGDVEAEWELNDASGLQETPAFSEPYEPVSHPSRLIHTNCLG